MKYFRFFVLFLLVQSLAPLQAAGPPLDIVVTNFAPPFIMQAGNNQFFGFDISMMEYVCQKIQRSCHYRSLPFTELLNAIQTKQADLGIGAITITLERAKRISFSDPYLPSQSSFIALATTPDNIAVGNNLANQKIGVAEGTVFIEQLASLGISADHVVKYANTEAILADLQAGNVTLALIDTPTANYWQAQSSSALKIVGKPMSFGYGFGIAVNPAQLALLAEINHALLLYHADRAFENDYQKYLASFKN